MAAYSTQQARLQDDLRGLVEGDVRCDDIIAQLYATDASLFEYHPAGVVWPRSAKDVAAAVNYCAENKIPIHPRGSGTSSTGGSLGPGIVLDFTRYMRRILHASEESVTVQPGAIRERFNDILKRSTGRFFAPSAGFLPTSTLGCIVSTDMAGPRWIAYGFPHNYVEELEIVTASGEILEIKPIKISNTVSTSDIPEALFSSSGDDLKSLSVPTSGGYWDREPFQKLRKILQDYDSVIAEEQSDHIPNRAGYLLRGIAKGDNFNPTRLFTGAEGSLGIITRMTLKTSERPKFSGGAILLFDSLEKTANSVTPILEEKPILCELIDRRAINMLCRRGTRFQPFFPVAAEYALLIEFHAETESELKEKITGAIRSIRYDRGLCFGAFALQTDSDRFLFEEILRMSELALLHIDESFQVISLFEDLQVPVSRLSEFLVVLRNLLKKYNLVYSLGGHLGQGQIRVLPILNLKEEYSLLPMTSFAEEASAEAIRLGGTVSSAYGSGLSRTRFIAARYPKLFPAFTEIKKAFDPKGIMNPQRGIELPEFESLMNVQKKRTQEMTIWNRSLRVHHRQKDFQPQSDSSFFFPEEMKFFSSQEKNNNDDNLEDSQKKDSQEKAEKERPNQLEIQFRWDRKEIAGDVFQCTGCGLCRSRTPDRRMCPSFRHYPDEQASCRAKANVLRGVLDGTLRLEDLAEDSLKTIGDLCINCHCCQSECPTGTDIPKLTFRLQSAYGAAHGFSLVDQFLSHTDQILKMGTVFSCPFNFLNLGRRSRWLIEKTFGLAQGRRFPKVEKISYLSKVAWKRQSVSHSAPVPNKPNRKVLLFVDTFANYFDTKLAEAARRILIHNGVEVAVPTRQRASGHQAFAIGNRDRAERLSRLNLALLADYVRQGYKVVTIEPISAVCISREYGWIQDSPDVWAVAEKTVDLMTYLRQMAKDGDLALDLAPLALTAGYHAPCRTLALTGDPLSVPTPAEEILHLIPELTVRRLERGCCGLAGPNGFKKNNHMMSLRLGMPLFLALRDSSLDIGVTECNFCRIQLEQGTDKKVFHPAKLLAVSYGLFTAEELLGERKSKDVKDTGGKKKTVSKQENSSAIAQ